MVGCGLPEAGGGAVSAALTQNDYVKGIVDRHQANIRDGVVAWGGNPLTLSDVYRRWATTDEGFMFGIAGLISDHPWGVFFEEKTPHEGGVNSKYLDVLTLWFQFGEFKNDKVMVASCYIPKVVAK